MTIHKAIIALLFVLIAIILMAYPVYAISEGEQEQIDDIIKIARNKGCDAKQTEKVDELLQSIVHLINSRNEAIRSQKWQESYSLLLQLEITRVSVIHLVNSCNEEI